MATYSMEAYTDDCLVRFFTKDSSYAFALDANPHPFGRSDTQSGGGWYYQGSGMRFKNVTIAQGATIVAAYLACKCGQANSETVIRSRITGDDEDNAAAWTTLADFQSRRGTVVGGADNSKITTAQVDWDSIAAWSLNTIYNSPSIVSIIQEIVNRVGWASGNSLALWIDDYNQRSDIAAVRNPYSFDVGGATAVQLIVTTPTPRSRAYIID